MTDTEGPRVYAHKDTKTTRGGSKTTLEVEGSEHDDIHDVLKAFDERWKRLQRDEHPKHEDTPRKDQP